MEYQFVVGAILKLLALYVLYEVAMALRASCDGPQIRAVEQTKKDLVNVRRQFHRIDERLKKAFKALRNQDFDRTETLH